MPQLIGKHEVQVVNEIWFHSRGQTSNLLITLNMFRVGTVHPRQDGCMLRIINIFHFKILYFILILTSHVYGSTFLLVGYLGSIILTFYKGTTPILLSFQVGHK